MIERSEIGKKITIRGEEFVVLDFSQKTCVDDWGFGPVWDSYAATLQCVESGEILEINWED